MGIDYAGVADLCLQAQGKKFTWAEVQEFKNKLRELCGGELFFVHLPKDAKYYTQSKSVEILFVAPDEHSDFLLEEVNITVPPAH